LERSFQGVADDASLGYDDLAIALAVQADPVLERPGQKLSTSALIRRRRRTL
jgi:hypothetical protein